MTLLLVPISPEDGPGRVQIEDLSGGEWRTLEIEAGSALVDVRDPQGFMPPLAPRNPAVAFPNLFELLTEVFFGRPPESEQEREQLEWIAADLVLARPDLTLDTDDVDASAGYALVDAIAFRGGVEWTGRFLLAGDQAGAEDADARIQPVYWNVEKDRGYVGERLRGGNLPDASTPWWKWPLPRLETPRSLRARLQPGSGPKLDKPDVSDEFFRAYSYLLLTNRAFRSTARGFLGLHNMPLGSSLAFPDSKLKSMHDLAHRRAFRTRPSFSMRRPSLAESDAWFIDRVLNGMHPCLFQERQGQHEGHSEKHYVVEFDWNHLVFEDVSKSVHKREALADFEFGKNYYELPNARVVFAKNAANELVVRRIVLQHRKRLTPNGRGAPLRGPVTAADLEPPEVYEPPVAGVHSETWSYAKRAFRCQLAMAGELDVHLGGAHLVTEQFMAALVTTHDMPRSSKNVPGHPVWELLHPYLREVERINAFGDLLIIADEGVLANSTAITAESTLMRFREALGSRDWKGFAPRSELCQRHHYARAAKGYWSIVHDFVEGYVDDYWAEIEQRWASCEKFGETLSARSVRYRPYAGSTDPRDWEAGSRSELVFRPPGGPSMSELPHKASSSEGERRAALIQLCTYAIYHATFVHSWANDRQFDDLGDPSHSSLGLMTRQPPPAGASARELAAWEERAQPLLRDAGFTMMLTRVLSHMNVGYLLSSSECDASRMGEPEPHFLRPGDNPPHRALATELLRRRAEYEIPAGDDDPRIGPERSPLDLPTVCRIRSHINT